MKEHTDNIVYLKDEEFKTLITEIGEENYIPRIHLPEDQEELLKNLVEKYKLKDSRNIILIYCSQLIPDLKKGDKVLLETSKSELNAQREYWDKIIEGLQDIICNKMVTSYLHLKKERLESMLKEAEYQRNKLKKRKATKQKPINLYLTPIVYSLHWHSGFTRSNIVDFIYDLYCTYEYGDYGQMLLDNRIYSPLSDQDKKQHENSRKRDDKKKIDYWLRKNYGPLKSP